MNYLTVLIIALTAAPIILGFLFGLLRGSRRSILRLVLIIVCVVGAFLLCGLVADKVLEAQVQAGDEGETMTLAELLQQQLLDGMPEAVTDVALGIVQSIVKVVMFLLLFGVLQFLTWAIVFPIFKIFIKPKTVKSNGQVIKKKRRLLGGLVGVVQGAVIALCICVVFNGLIVQTNNVMMAVDDLSSIGAEAQTIDEDSREDEYDSEYPEEEDDEGQSPEEGEQPSDEGFGDMFAMVGEYTESAIGKFYTKIGSKPFDWISEVKTDKGTITLSGQVDAVRGVVKMAKELMRLKDIDFNSIFAEGNAGTIQDIFDSLQEINKNLSKEARDTIKNVLEGLGDELGLPVDLSEVDFNEIDFSKEGEIFTNLLDYKNKDEINPEDVQDILDNLVESDLILDVLGSQGDDVDLGSQLRAEDGNTEYLEAIEDKIAQMEGNPDYDQEKVDKLKSIFGIA